MCSSSGNGGAGRHGQEREEAVELLGRGRDEVAVPAQHLRRALQRPEHRPGERPCRPGAAWNMNEVTTPKLPPPPRIAQKRSGFSSSFAVTTLPSASTTSAPSRLSIDRPSPRLRWPIPPPSVRPPTPVVEMIPPASARPMRVRRVVDVARAARRRRRCTVRSSASTSTPFIGGEVDHQAVVDAPRPGAVVAAAADRDVEPVLAGEVDRGDDVGHVGARARSAPAACRSSRCRPPAPRRSWRHPRG